MVPTSRPKLQRRNVRTTARGYRTATAPPTSFGRRPTAGWGENQERSGPRRSPRRPRAPERTRAGGGAYGATVDQSVNPDGSWRPMPSWQQMLLLVIGGGIIAGLLAIWLLATAYLGPAALLALPAGAGLVAGFKALRRRRPQPAPRRRPLVADLVRAAQEMHEAEAVVQRLRQERS